MKTSESVAANRWESRSVGLLTAANDWYRPSPAAYPASCRMAIAWSGARLMRLACSWRTTAGRDLPGKDIRDANLGFAVLAAQEVRIVDERHAHRLQLFELRSGVGADHHRGRLLRDG